MSICPPTSRVSAIPAPLSFTLPDASRLLPVNVIAPADPTFALPLLSLISVSLSAMPPFSLTLKSPSTSIFVFYSAMLPFDVSSKSLSDPFTPLALGTAGPRAVRLATP
ncbi:hypothetical protein, partial [Burkholderia pseudomallei]|uniref:hypothetical protein n=1 Tax=Burkholderia pseudomallei TaxID=28450 RepID=UPI0021F6C1EC